HLARDVRGARRRKRSLALHLLLERAPEEQLEGDVEEPRSIHAGVEDAHDVRVMEPAGELGLTPHARLTPREIEDLAREQLQGDARPARRGGRGEARPEAALPEELVETVPSGDEGPEPRQVIHAPMVACREGAGSRADSPGLGSDVTRQWNRFAPSTGS